MKKKIISLLIILSIFLVGQAPLFAHPGRTDANGGHYVKTAGWGYPVGSYHYHNGGSSTTKTQSTSSKSSTKATVKPIKIYVNDELLSTGKEPTLTSGRVIVPVKPIAEALGASIEWDATNNTSKINKDKKKISIPIGQKYAYVNGQKVQLDAAAKVSGGYTMVPLRFVSENFNANVTWDSSSRTIQIYSK